MTYTANDGRGGATSTTFTHTIQAGTPANQAPVASTPIPNRTANAGQSFSHGLPANAFVDPEGQTLSYSLAGGGGGALPFGNLSINGRKFPSPSSGHSKSRDSGMVVSILQRGHLVQRVVGVVITMLGVGSYLNCSLAELIR